MAAVDRTFGRHAFGGDPAGYDRARPGYPDWVWDLLQSRAGLGSGAKVFEVGAGAGLATRQLLALGANPLVAIEPDARSAAYLSDITAHPALDVRLCTFEDAELALAEFDLGLAATAFHWIDPTVGLAKVASVLKPGGWWATVWNVFGDPSRADPFHVATDSLLNGVRSLSSPGDGALPYALDIASRRRDLNENGNFDLVEYRLEPWTLTLNTAGMRALYATYSNVTVRAAVEQERILDGLCEIADREFGGVVQRNMVTVLYLARRRIDD